MRHRSRDSLTAHELRQINRSPSGAAALAVAHGVSVDTIIMVRTEHERARTAKRTYSGDVSPAAPDPAPAPQPTPVALDEEAARVLTAWDAATEAGCAAILNEGATDAEAAWYRAQRVELRATIAATLAKGV